jgi:thymidylate synthase
MLAKRVNMVPDELIGNLGDTHLYSNHLEQAKEQISREGFELPQVELDFEYTYFDGYITEFDKIDRNSIKLVNYKSHSEIKAPLSN